MAQNYNLDVMSFINDIVEADNTIIRAYEVNNTTYTVSYEDGLNL